LELHKSLPDKKKPTLSLKADNALDRLDHPCPHQIRATYRLDKRCRLIPLLPDIPRTLRSQVLSNMLLENNSSLDPAILLSTIMLPAPNTLDRLGRLSTTFKDSCKYPYSI